MLSDFFDRYGEPAVYLSANDVGGELGIWNGMTYEKRQIPYYDSKDHSYKIVKKGRWIILQHGLVEGTDDAGKGKFINRSLFNKDIDTCYFKTIILADSNHTQKQT